MMEQLENKCFCQTFLANDKLPSWKLQWNDLNHPAAVILIRAFVNVKDPVFGH